MPRRLEERSVPPSSARRRRPSSAPSLLGAPTSIPPICSSPPSLSTAPHLRGALTHPLRLSQLPVLPSSPSRGVDGSHLPFIHPSAFRLPRPFLTSLLHLSFFFLPSSTSHGLPLLISPSSAPRGCLTSILIPVGCSSPPSPCPVAAPHLHPHPLSLPFTSIPTSYFSF